MSLLLLFLTPPTTPPSAPTVTTTSPVDSIGANQANGAGTVTSTGTAVITEGGIVISESSNPTTSNTKYVSTVQIGSFNVTLLGLKPNTTYHIRAFATNSVGTSYGADVSFTTRLGVLKKTYYYKVYDDGIYVKTWSQEVISEPNFKNTINAGAGNMDIEIARKFDDFGEDEDVKLNNKVEIWVVDKEQPNGQLLYTGYISGYRPLIKQAKESVIITVFGFVAETARMILRDSGGNTTIAYNSYDPALMLKDVIDKYRSLGGNLIYTAASIDLTNTVVSYTFNTNSIKECIDTIIELCPVGWYFKIEADGTVYLKPRNVLATHKFTLGIEVENLETFRRIEDLVNRVLFTGGGSPPLFRVYQNTGSQDAYGLYEIKKVDQRVTLAATASIISNRLIDTFKDPEIRSKFTIVDSNGPKANRGYDIESIKVGDTLLVKGLKSAIMNSSLWDSALWDFDVWDQTISASAADVIQILSIDYKPDSIVIEASSRLPQIAKRIEDINRNLQNTQTVDNPVAPS